jgi:hypothetical protein
MCEAVNQVEEWHFRPLMHGFAASIVYPHHRCAVLPDAAFLLSATTDGLSPQVQDTIKFSGICNHGRTVSSSTRHNQI